MVLHRPTCQVVAVWYSLRGSVRSCSQSWNQIWISLAEKFNKSNVPRQFSLRSSFQVINIKDKPFSTYCREFKAICDSLSSIGKPVDESMKIFGFLNGLGREYDPITTVIQSSLRKIPALMFNDVISDVQDFDRKLQTYGNTVAASTCFQHREIWLHSTSVRAKQ